MEYQNSLLLLLSKSMKQLDAQFSSLPLVETEFLSSSATDILSHVATRLGDNYPYFHPLYVGQMLKPPHPVAHAAYALAMRINPNNHALDGGRASSFMEIEAVREIATMFGFGEFLGHLTSSGTIANLEALWVAGRERPGARILASAQAHYTHQRISAVLGLTCSSVPTDHRGRMDLNALEAELKLGNVGTVVATLGTTAIGAVDPLDGIIALQQKYGFRIHVDAAYGGYFKLTPAALDSSARNAFACTAHADSIVVDPHKHGLQPYGCGSVLFRSPAVGRHYKHDSPYTYFTSNELHLGEISLECSRAGAAAVALWATQRLLPLVEGGEFASDLTKSLTAARQLHSRLAADSRFITMPTAAPELDLVVWRVNPSERKNTSANATESNPGESLEQQLFDAAAALNLHLALVKLPAQWFDPAAPADQTVPCLRSTLMKPEHLDWLDEIWRLLSLATDQVLVVA